MNNNEQVETNHDMDYEKDNKKTKQYITIEIYKYISGLLTFLFSLAMVVKNIYQYIYSVEAEIFYGIPQNYFYKNILGEINIKLIFVIINLILLFLPIIIKRLGKKIRLSRIEAFGYSVIITTLIFNTLLTLVISIISNNKIKYINNSIFSGVAILIIILIFSIGSFYIYFKFLTNNYNSTEDDIGTKNIKETQFTNEKVEKKNRLCENKTAYLINIIIVVIIIGSIITFFINIELPNNKKNYEVVFEGSEPKKIVVTEYQDYFVLMDIEKIKENSKNNINKVILKKHFYELKKKGNLKMKYINIKEVLPDKQWQFGE